MMPRYWTRSERGPGFTLLEMLVVLLLVGMIVTILTQGLSQAFTLVNRSESQNQVLRTESIRWAALLRLVNGLQTVPVNARASTGLGDENQNKPFEGDATRMRGITINPITAQVGVPQRFELRMQYLTAQSSTVLVFEADGQTVNWLTWQGSAGKFEYLDADGQLHQQWPPLGSTKTQLPAAIKISGRRIDRAFTVYAATESALDPVFNSAALPRSSQ